MRFKCAAVGDRRCETGTLLKMTGGMAIAARAERRLAHDDAAGGFIADVLGVTRSQGTR